MDRKEFLKWSGAAVCGMSFLSTFIAACNKSDNTAQPAAGFTLDLTAAENAALQGVGGSVNKNNINIVHTASGYVAVSAVCTHQGCTVGYLASSSQFRCPCHGGMFDINGNVLSGPPPSALKKYTVTQNGNILSIT